MTPDFLWGMLVALTPSLLTVAWFVFANTGRDPQSLDYRFNDFGESICQDNYPGDCEAQTENDDRGRPKIHL